MRSEINIASSFEVPLSNEYEDLMLFYKEYSDLIQLIKNGDRWIDNGLRVCSKVIGVPKDYKERGMALENELGRILHGLKRKKVLDYRLQYPMGKYQIADAIINILKGNKIVRIEAKYISPELVNTNWKYKNLLEWSTKYRWKPKYFFPYIILYLNYEAWKTLKTKDFKLCYRNRMIVANFRTLERIIGYIENREYSGR